MQNKILLALLGCLFVLASCEDAGISYALDSAVLKDFTDPVAPMVVDIINRVTFDEIKVDDFTFTDIKVQLNAIDPDYITLGLSGADNAMRMTAQNVGGVITGHYTYWWLLLYSQGKFEVTIQDGGAQIYTSIPFTYQMDGDRMLPAVECDSFSFNINKDKVDVKIYGSLTADIVNIFMQIFDDLVLDIIMNVVNDEAQDIIVEETNGFFMNRHGYLTVDSLNGLSFDYAYTAPPFISDTQLDLYLNATFYNANIGEHSPGEGFADMTVDPSTRGQVQLDVSRYTVESFLLTLYESEKLQVVLNDDVVPGTTGFAFDTSHMEEFLPGLIDVYGEEVPMEVFLFAKEMPKVVFSPDVMSGFISLGAEFRILGVETAIILSFMDAEAVFDLSLEDFLLYIHFDELKVGDIVIEDSKIGSVDTSSMLKNLNRLLKLGLPVINAYFSSGFEIPQHYFSHTVVADASFTPFYNYVKIQWEPYIEVASEVPSGFISETFTATA